MLKKMLVVVFGFFACLNVGFAAVNINTATEEQLSSLPGIGPSYAKAIVDYRKSNGNFKTADELKNVKGIGDKKYAKLASQVSVSGATEVAMAEPKTAKPAKASSKSSMSKDADKAAKK